VALSAFLSVAQVGRVGVRWRKVGCKWRCIAVRFLSVGLSLFPDEPSMIFKGRASIPRRLDSERDIGVTQHSGHER
jgi:hypothetical protein